jgi:hypothetical protein
VSLLSQDENVSTSVRKPFAPGADAFTNTTKSANASTDGLPSAFVIPGSSAQAIRFTVTEYSPAARLSSPTLSLTNAEKLARCVGQAGVV